VDLSGRLWLTSSNGGVSHVDDPSAEKLQFVTLTINDGLVSNNTRTITEDKFGNLYVGSVSGVDRISSDTRGSNTTQSGMVWLQTLSPIRIVIGMVCCGSRL
jgi:ligand-binding sensor domain-containing protein